MWLANDANHQNYGQSRTASQEKSEGAAIKTTAATATARTLVLLEQLHHYLILLQYCMRSKLETVCENLETLSTTKLLYEQPSQKNR
jgi:hypothetical protein